MLTKRTALEHLQEYDFRVLGAASANSTANSILNSETWRITCLLNIAERTRGTLAGDIESSGLAICAQNVIVKRKTISSKVISRLRRTLVSKIHILDFLSTTK